MNFPRLLSFAIPTAIIIFAIIGHVATSAAQPSMSGFHQRKGNFINLGIGLYMALLMLALVATQPF